MFFMTATKRRTSNSIEAYEKNSNFDDLSTLFQIALKVELQRQVSVVTL
jgi:hypothetical protein